MCRFVEIYEFIVPECCFSDFLRFWLDPCDPDIVPTVFCASIFHDQSRLGFHGSLVAMTDNSTEGNSSEFFGGVHTLIITQGKEGVKNSNVGVSV